MTAFDFLNSSGEKGTMTTGVQFSFSATPNAGITAAGSGTTISSTLTSNSEAVTPPPPPGALAIKYAVLTLPTYLPLRYLTFE